MQVIVGPNSVVEKREDGIYVDGIQILIKDFTLYAIMYLDKCESKKEAEEIYNSKSAREILEDYFYERRV